MPQNTKSMLLPFNKKGTGEMNIPYNNGKVQIGKYYVPPKYIETDSDMLELQSYLIYDPARLNKAYWTEKGLLLLGLFIVLIIFLKS